MLEYSKLSLMMAFSNCEIIHFWNRWQFIFRLKGRKWSCKENQKEERRYKNIHKGTFNIYSICKTKSQPDISSWNIINLRFLKKVWVFSIRKWITFNFSNIFKSTIGPQFVPSIWCTIFWYRKINSDDSNCEPGNLQSRKDVILSSRVSFLYPGFPLWGFFESITLITLEILSISTAIQWLPPIKIGNKMFELFSNVPKSVWAFMTLELSSNPRGLGNLWYR